MSYLEEEGKSEHLLDIIFGSMLSACNFLQNAKSLGMNM